MQVWSAVLIADMCITRLENHVEPNNMLTCARFPRAVAAAACFFHMLWASRLYFTACMSTVLRLSVSFPWPSSPWSAPATNSLYCKKNHSNFQEKGIMLCQADASQCRHEHTHLPGCLQCSHPCYKMGTPQSCSGNLEDAFEPSSGSVPGCGNNTALLNQGL